MSIEEKKILLLETVVANQMQMIDLLNMLNHNVITKIFILNDKITFIMIFF